MNDNKRVYTIKEAIGELDSIRMDADRIAKHHDAKIWGHDQGNKELAALVSELASVTGWLARHLDHLDSELVIDEAFETADGPVMKSELFSGGTMDGENSHPGMKRR
jgi:hypothetical protein